MDIQLIFFIILFSTLLSIPAWWVASKRKYFSLIEILVPAICVEMWYLLGGNFDRQKSLANLMEVILFIPSLNIVTAYVKAFILNKIGLSPKHAIFLYFFINIVGALLIFFCVPALEE